MKKLFKRVLAAVLCVCMSVSGISLSAFAANDTEFTSSKLSVVTNKESTLATGVTLDQYTVYDKNGDQVKMFVTTADPSVETVKLFASYKDMDPTNYGMSKLTEQVASFNEKAAAGDEYYQGTVVAGINASYYNMINGKPTGTFVMNGIDVTTESEGNAYGYFAVMKDGSVKIGKPGDYSKDKGNIQEAIGIYKMLIEDGVMVSGLDDVTKYPRQTIGITADGKVVLMMADGNQAPTSIGLTYAEQAQVMEDLGCVWAGHLDGGGSGTYACKPEGADEFVVTNSPSDGSERSISNGFIIVSTEATSYEFAKVLFEVNDEYMTPGTSVKVNVAGASSTGNAADIPADVTYVTTNGTYADGVFTAGSEVGDATITAMYNGKAVGTTTVNVVIPEAISFNNTEITVPFGKTVSLGMTATYGVKDVAIKAADFNFVLSDSTIGTIDGFDFTAADVTENAATKATLTATFVRDDSLVASANITLGKGSEVVYDFEDGTNQKVIFDETPGTKYNYVWPETKQNVVDATTGKVHSGDKALAMHVNYGNSLESGYMKTSLYAEETRVFENAVRIGAWIYIPDECVGLWARWTLRTASSVEEDGTINWNSGTVNSNAMDTTDGGTGIVYTFDEPGWHYLYADIDPAKYPFVGWMENGAMMQFYISDRDGSAYNYTASENSNIPGNFQFYLDDVTVDYSSAVDDREAPVFGNMTYAVEGMADAATLDSQTITTDKVTFAASLADYTGKTNHTGLDNSSIKAYIDGVEVDYTFAGGKVTVDAEKLTNGLHTIKFSACDKMGNYSSEYGYINVNAEKSASTVKLVAQNPEAKYPLLGSIYNLDLVATAIEEVQSVEVVVDLDNNSTWELDHMEPAEGFEASYTLDETENIATITVTRTGENSETGEKALVTLPVRVWTLKTGYKYENGTMAGQDALTLAGFKAKNEFWRMSIIATVDKGVLTRTDASVSTFTGERVFCDTEMWGNYARMSSTDEGKAYYNSWNGGHVHAATAINDVAATCTEAGYAGRTYCEGCSSVVDWGTTIPATGHTYEVVDGVLKCTATDCGVVFNGEYTDGKYYVDGVVAEGWLNDKYYVDGVALTGINLVDGLYYDFGEDGISKGKYTGLIYDEEAQVYRYSQIGELASGWKQIEEDWYYFEDATLAPVAQKTFTFTKNKVTYEFEPTGKIISGVWVKMEDGTRYYYGPDYYKLVAKTGNVAWYEVDGNLYGFNKMGYRYEGVSFCKESNNPMTLHVFEEDGIYVGKYNGIYDGKYYVDGLVKGGLGIVKEDGCYYYIPQSGKLYVGTIYVTETMANGYFPAGTYVFLEDGKMDLKQGIVDGFYYEDGVLIKGKGLVKIDNAYYYIGQKGQVYVGTIYITETKANGYFPAGTYVFLEDGKMDLKQGIVDGFYYEDGVLIKSKGLIKIDGYYYYIGQRGQVYVGTIYITETKANGYFPAGTYVFLEDGKMDLKQGIVDGYYYEDGVLIKGKGLVLIDGSYYYIGQRGQVYTGSIYITEAKSNGYLEAGKYTFGTDGTMITN